MHRKHASYNLKKEKLMSLQPPHAISLRLSPAILSHLVLLILLSISFSLKAILSPLSCQPQPQLKPYLLLLGPLNKSPLWFAHFPLVHPQNSSLRDV